MGIQLTGAGNRAGCVLGFLRKVSGRLKPNEAIDATEKSNAPGNTIVPSAVILKSGEDPFRGVLFLRASEQDYNHNDVAHHMNNHPWEQC